jgi:hypothetical protein
MEMSSLTYIPGFSVKFFFQPIYTDYANYRILRTIGRWGR